MALIDEIREKCPPDMVEARRIGEITALVSAGRTRITQPMLIGEGTVSNVLGLPAGPIFLRSMRLTAEADLPEGASMEQFAQKAMVEQAWRLLQAGNLDIGLPHVRAGITGMVDVLPGLTAEGAQALLDLAVVANPYPPRAILLALEGEK